MYYKSESHFVGVKKKVIRDKKLIYSVAALLFIFMDCGVDVFMFRNCSDHKFSFAFAQIDDRLDGFAFSATFQFWFVRMMFAHMNTQIATLFGLV